MHKAQVWTLIWGPEVVDVSRLAGPDEIVWQLAQRIR